MFIQITAMRLARWLAPLSFVAGSSIPGVANFFCGAPGVCRPCCLHWDMPWQEGFICFLGGLHLDASREPNKLNPPWFNSRV